MHTPSHLAQYTPGHRDGSYYLPPGLSIENLMGIALAPAPPIPVMDRKDQIFVELLRLRRYATRLTRWQFIQRRRITAQINSLLAEQASL